MTEVIPENNTPQRRGRPKGSTDKKKRKTRLDNTQYIIPEDDRRKVLAHDIEVMKLGKLKNRNDPEELTNRIEVYYSICLRNGIMPTVAGFALALGIDRTTLWDWISNRKGIIQSQQVSDILKNTYAQINAQYEELLTQGKMIPVSAFFLMQNNHGYKQQTDHIITANQDNTLSISDISERAGLLTD